MEPISLSLMAISACSVAIRRIDAAQRAERDASTARAPKPGVHALVMNAVSQKNLERFAKTADPIGLRGFLVSDAPRHDVATVLDLPLQECFDIDGPNSVLLKRALTARRVDAMICDPDGMPLCGLQLPPTDASFETDPIRNRVFRDAGLPLLVLPEDCTWHDALERVTRALDGHPQETAEHAVDDGFAESLEAAVRSQRA
ncbi:MAG: hypothetical protein AAF919_13410 [Pseudomonadota bacterium]